MIKGIHASAFAPGTPWVEGARLAKDAGFDAIEPVLTAEGELTPSTGESDCRRLGEAIRACGMQLAGLGGGLFWQIPLTSPDSAIRQQAMELAVAALDRASWLGAPVVQAVPGLVGRWNSPQPATRYEEALYQTYEALRTLAYEAERRNVIFAIENVWNRLLLSPVEMRELVDRLSTPWIRVYFDVGNVLRHGYPQDWIDTLGSRIARVHVRDFRLEVGTNKGFCLPGEGDVDWPAVMEALQRIRYAGPLTYEGTGNLNEISRALDRVMGRA